MGKLNGSGHQCNRDNDQGSGRPVNAGHDDHVPCGGNLTLFADLVRIGTRLLSLHLMKSVGNSVSAFPSTGDNRVDKVWFEARADGAAGRVFINLVQYFEGVEPEIWKFTVGGCRPAEKWLKDRKGRVLS